MKYARIEEGVVTGAIEGPEGYVPPAGYIECPVETDIGATYVDGVFTNLPAPIPQVVSRFQARAALHLGGYLATIETAIAQADPLAQLAWSDALEFRRTSPTVLAISSVVGLTDAQLDALFALAATIEA